MVNWIVQKVRQPTDTEITEDCLTGNVVAEVTLKDTDTGTFKVLQICFDPSVAPCAAGGLLHWLNLGGYTPADWDAECGF